MLKEGIALTGVPSEEELEKATGIPTKERLNKGPIAFVECFQLISCDPCIEACPYGAITMDVILGTERTRSTPRLNEDICIGCGVCIPHCPGQAIFVVDKTYSETEALVSFPHEFLPLPTVGEEVGAVNRKGEVVTKGRVIRVLNPENYDHTAVVTIAIPKELAEEVRGVSQKRGDWNE